MAVGTAAALLPIKSITRNSTSDKFIYQNGADQPGPCTLKLSETIKGIQKGKIEDTFGWCVVVEETTLGETNVDVQMIGDASAEVPEIHVEMAMADVEVEDAKADEGLQVDAKTNGHAVVDETKLEERPTLEEEVNGAVRVDESKTEEKTNGYVNFEDATAEEGLKVEKKSQEDLRVEEVKISEGPTPDVKLNGYVIVEESRLDELLEVQ